MFYAVLGMPTLTSEQVSYRSFQYLIIGGSLVIALLEPRIVALLTRRDPVELWWSRPAWLRGVGYAALVILLVVFGGSAQKFVYFDF
jgi:alginate O-acetyltransferase complex protein AlgI